MSPGSKTLLLVPFCISFIAIQGAGISRKKTLIWGPGLRDGAVVPARYFFIQTVDTQGRNLTESPGESIFDVRITTSHGRARVWVQLLDRRDGSFIVRFRLFASCRDLSIEVLYKDKHVAQSPYKLTEGVYHEGCYCPQPDTIKWEEAMQCPDNYSQVDRDLQKFSKINLQRLAKEGVERFGKHNALCHYSVINNKVYRKTHGEHVGFSMFMDAILLSLTRKIRLPDMEFFVNLGDWPLERKINNPLPILSWCGSEETSDIVMPTYDLTEAALEAMGRVSLDMLSVQANTGPKWKDKIPKAFWRGRDSKQERLDLVVMGRKKPELYDVALTNFFFFPYDEKKYGPKMKHISFFDFFKWKYQINIDGTVAAYRMPYLIAGDSVVLKQDSNYYEHFYKDLKPWEHYIPFKRDLSDLEEKLQWAINNDDKARKIAQEAQKYARDNLQAIDVFCYHWVLFRTKCRSLEKKFLSCVNFKQRNHALGNDTWPVIGNITHKLKRNIPKDKQPNPLYTKAWNTSSSQMIMIVDVTVLEKQKIVTSFDEGGERRARRLPDHPNSDTIIIAVNEARSIFLYEFLSKDFRRETSKDSSI